MLIVVPPSETKRRPAAAGQPVNLDELSFPELAQTRRQVLDALIETSSGLDAFERLGVRPTFAREVAENALVLELPAMPVLDLYTGPLHEGLDAARLSAPAAARADRDLVVASALWGALRPEDLIPPYRLHLVSWLVGLDRLDRTWRDVLPDVLADAAGPDGLVVDLRSPVYQQMGMPSGLGDRTVTLRIDLGRRGHRVGDVIAKRVRGEAAHYLLESGAQPADPHELAGVLADRWPARLDTPERRGKPWVMTLSLD